MDQVVQMVNYVKPRPLQSRLLAKISEEMGEKFKNVLLHTEVHWLSRGRVLCRVYELREMMLQLFRKICTLNSVILFKTKFGVQNWHILQIFLSI